MYCFWYAEISAKQFSQCMLIVLHVVGRSIDKPSAMIQ